jgi:hypothetical protein
LECFATAMWWRCGIDMLNREATADQTLIPAATSDAPPADLLPRTDRELDLSVSIHDSSRFQWQLVMTLPHTGHVNYEVEAEFEIPSNALSGRSPWDLIQGLTRFDSDAPVGATDGALTSLRQKVMSLARMLDRARAGFARHCQQAISHAQCEEPHDAHQELVSWLDAAFRSVSASRAELALASPNDSSDVSRERCLADEFISVRWIEFLAESQQFLKTSLDDQPAITDELRKLLELADRRLSEALETELAYRQAQRFISADPSVSDTLEKYVERAGRLKQRFQEVLSLDREVYPLDDRVHQWVTTFSALLAGMLFFGTQLLLSHWTIGSRLSSGLALLILVAGIGYALRDRLKELSSAWISGKVYRFHAQRIVLCRLSLKKEIVVRAREWCNETTTGRPDPLNPETGASRRVTVVHHLHRGKLIANPQISASGAHRIRHIFRYDLSPLFARLHDPVKRVPVVDPVTRRASFVDAPRRYQLPIQLRATFQDSRTEVQANLIVDKLGIQRLEQKSA